MRGVSFTGVRMSGPCTGEIRPVFGSSGYLCIKTLRCTSNTSNGPAAKANW
jgi:hypothetical protein